MKALLLSFLYGLDAGDGSKFGLDVTDTRP
jgi:hypothetical protein